MTSNSLAIAFGLKNGEFEGIKRGYPERHKNYCGDLSKCHNDGGRCLDVTDYTIGWDRDGDQYTFAYKLLVPDNSVKQTTTEETTTMATCPPVVNCPPVGNYPDVECPPCGTGCPTVGFTKAVTNPIQPQNSTKIVEIKPQNGSSLPSPANDCYNEGTEKDSKKTLQITLASNVHRSSHLSIRQQKQIKGKDSELLDKYRRIVVIFVIYNIGCSVYNL
uniref:Uncharacterized protein n=1 Tax=Meloidogyne floridensis TaxID=298350 RepID=A0A915NRU4_9BILA